MWKFGLKSESERQRNRSAQAARVLIRATNDLPEVAEQVEAATVAVITESGLRLLPDALPVEAS